MRYLYEHSMSKVNYLLTERYRYHRPCSTITMHSTLLYQWISRVGNILRKNPHSLTGVDIDWGWHWLGLTLTGVDIDWGYSLTGVDIDWGWHWLGLTLTGVDIDWGYSLTGVDIDWGWHWLGLTLTGVDIDWGWHQTNHTSEEWLHNWATAASW